jgi:hypothetical protein
VAELAGPASNVRWPVDTARLWVGLTDVQRFLFRVAERPLQRRIAPRREARFWLVRMRGIEVDARFYFPYTLVSLAAVSRRTSLPASLANFEPVKGRLEPGCTAVLP